MSELEKCKETGFIEIGSVEVGYKAGFINKFKYS